VIAVDTRRPARDRWREVIPQAGDKLESVQVIAGRFVAEYLHDAHSRIQFFALDGRSMGDLKLPTLGSVYQMRGKRDGDEMFYAFTSFLYPTTIFRYDFRTARTSSCGSRWAACTRCPTCGAGASTARSGIRRG
jgi:prolyl oligopeptidase